MYRKWTFKYSTAAVVAAVVVIAISLLALPQSPIQKASGSTVAVLFTDPPTVPAGTTQLNLTYTDFALHVTYPNGSSEWLPVSATGTVNLFSLINVTKTIATTTLPTNSTLDKVQFTIENVTAEVNSEIFNVTALSDTFVVNVANGKINQTLSGILIDFNPTLVQIQAQDENGTSLQYYVLVPSANAMIVGNLSQDHAKVGTIIKIGENNRVEIARVKQEFEKNVTIVSATLTVKGNETALSVTLENDGDVAFRVNGLTLHGEFNVTQTRTNHHDDEDEEDHNTGVESNAQISMSNRTETVPFKVDETSLIPLIQSGHEHHYSSITIQPGESITVSFTGTIAINAGEEHEEHNQGNITVLAPLTSGNYTIRLTGEGTQTFAVTATEQP